jgi:hypothetical protein
MMKERVKDMIHEILESGGSFTQAKGHDQELIVTLMSSKGSLGNVFLFHMYLVVARMEIRFSKVTNTTQLIQEVINERNGEFVFDGEFVEGTKVEAHVPTTLFLEYHDHGRGIGDGTRMDNTYFKQFLNNFLNFILLGKRMTIREKIGREDTRY